MSTDAISSSNFRSNDDFDLTIVVPVYNRAELVGRCLRSCLSQSGENVEVVVVDDASSDGTADAVRAFVHPRLRLFVQDQNKGVCAARGRGVLEARGEWIAFVDSDDELLEGAVGALLGAIKDCPPECGAIYHRDLHVSGIVSPVSVPRYGVLHYEDYIELMNANLHRFKDVFQCMRASALKRVPWPENRAPETEFHLNFLRQFPVLMREEALYKVNDDAPSRLSVAPRLESLSGNAELQRLESFERIIDAHGESLRIHGPDLWEHIVINLLSLEAIFSRRYLMHRYYRYGLMGGVRKTRLTMVYLAGLFGPKVTLRLRFLYKYLRDKILAWKLMSI